MSYGYDEFESKLGQFIYTMVMYERLKEYLLERLRGKDRLSVRINLGADKAGNQVFMDVVLTTVKPQLLQQGMKAAGKGRKTLLLVLSSDEVLGDRVQIADEMERLIVESLKWWHGYFGERDKLKLDTWRVERTELLDGEVAGVIVELPVNKIIIPPPLQLAEEEFEQEALREFSEVMAPITVRKTDSDMYELVGGVKLFNYLVNKLGYNSVRALVLDVDPERAASIRAEVEEKTLKLLKAVAGK
jgi:hypothetical protein